MFDPDTELTSDLEWMLESGQAERAQLADALVGEYASELYRSARLYLRDPDLARQAVERALGAALVDGYGYRPEWGVKAWLYRFLVAQWRKSKPARQDDKGDGWSPVDRQQPRLRELGILLYAAGFPLRSAARATGESAATTERRFSALRLNLLRTPDLASALRNEDRPTLDQRLAAAAQARCQSWNDPPLDLESLAAASLAEAERRGSQRRGWLLFRELAWVAVVIGLAAGLIWGGNGLLVGEAETPSPQITFQTRIVEITATPQPFVVAKGVDEITPRPTSSIEPGQAAISRLPLGLDSTSETIRSRVMSSFEVRKNIWLDADLRLYYPQSIQGVPQEYRVQFWLDNSNNRLLTVKREGKCSHPGNHPFFRWGWFSSPTFAKRQL